MNPGREAQEITFTATGEVSSHHGCLLGGQKDPQQLPRALLSSGAARTKSGGVNPPGASAAPKSAHRGRNQSVSHQLRRSHADTEVSRPFGSGQTGPVRPGKDLSLNICVYFLCGSGVTCGAIRTAD